MGFSQSRLLILDEEQKLKNHLPVNRFIHPDEFGEYREIGYGPGLDYVESGPLMRSSNHNEKHVI